MAQSKSSRSDAAKKAAATRKRNAKKAEEPQVDRGSNASSNDDQQSHGSGPHDLAQPSPPVYRPSPEQQHEELERERIVHAQRTGGGEVRKGELKEQRARHNERTGDPSRA
jgi:hypothetical protein